MIQNFKLLQEAIVNEFATRFIKSGSVLFLSGATKKDLFIDEKKLKELCIPVNQHNKLPHVIIYDPIKDWLFLIEAVTSNRPMSPKRIVELEELLKDCKTGKVYVSAFPDFDEYIKHSDNIAWETTVWIAETPDHMIHYNGGKFIMPRKTNLTLSE